MNERAPEFTHHVLQPAMHEKLLLRAAELVALGWTRGTAARDANGLKVRSTAPQATAWCVVGAVDRALCELWSLDVYALLGLEVDAYDTASCSLAVQRALRRPLQQALLRAVPIGSPQAPDAPLPDDLDEDLKRTGLAP